MTGRLEYSKFALLTLDHRALDEADYEPFVAGASSLARSINALDAPAAQAWFEDWIKENDIEWTCWTDELHIVISGLAEITYWDPPSWESTGTVSVGAGSMYWSPVAPAFVRTSRVRNLFDT